MCGIGLLVHHVARNDAKDGSDIIAQLRDSWEIDAASSSVSVSSFFPSNTAQFSESDLEDALRRRGPDQQGCRRFELNETGLVSLFGAVLHLRGDELARQPFDLPDGAAFAYNGEIFGGGVFRGGYFCI